MALSDQEQAFIDAYLEVLKAERKENKARQETYRLEEITHRKQTQLNQARLELIGHDRTLQTEEERTKLFNLIELARKQL